MTDYVAPRRVIDPVDPGLVDADQGIVSREIFVSQEIFDKELEQLFARCWHFIGHESQVPEPGDFFNSRIGTESVLFTRDSKGQLHALLKHGVVTQDSDCARCHGGMRPLH